MKASLKLLEEFFDGCDQSDWGYSDEQIAAMEAKLSVSFPEILKQYYRKFGLCPYIQQNGNNIPVPLALEDFFIPDETYNAPYTPKELDFLVFFSITNVSAIEYGIRLSDLALEDPPVYLCDWGNDSWYLENTSLLNFLVISAFWQIAYESRLDYRLDVSLPFDVRDDFDVLDVQELPELNSYVVGLGMDGCELENLSPVCYYRIFLKDGVMAACETDEWEIATEPPSEYMEWLTVTSNNREKIQAIQKIPGLLWNNE